MSTRIKIFADGADIDEMLRAHEEGFVQGFTTNPTLMRKSGVAEYESFCRKALERITKAPISFEVFADDFPTMEAQARLIASWGDNVYVKIPVTDTKGASSAPVIKQLSNEGIKLNVTAILTLAQVREVTEALSAATPAVVSVFAGRIADTGVDPIPVMSEALKVLVERPKAELLWASPREVLNIYQADQIGCHIITVTGDLIKKLSLKEKDLSQYSIETVKMFHNDAQAAGYSLALEPA
jgi:transaldolase